MSLRLRATYRNGAFIPLPGQTPPALAEATEVEITVQEPDAFITNAAERAAWLRETVANMKANSFTGNPPRSTREEFARRRQEMLVTK